MQHVHNPPRKRLDAFLVGKMLARSREHAVTLIKDGVVTVDGSVARKPSLPVTDDAHVLVNASSEREWASRGAYKLLGALEQFEPEGMNLAGKRVLDAGASTGGFTDGCLHEIPEGITVRAGSTRCDIEKKIMLRNSSIAHE